jgi:hypothetical protein
MTKFAKEQHKGETPIPCGVPFGFDSTTALNRFLDVYLKILEPKPSSAKSLPTTAFHAPLHPLDSEKQTYGCRHTTPNFCGKNSVPGICAFVRKDNICLLPPTSWKKQFQTLFLRKFPKQLGKRGK